MNTYVDQECIDLLIPAIDHLIAVFLHDVVGLLPRFRALGVAEKLFPCVPVFLSLGKQGGK